MKVSVIVPVYNAEKTLRPCLDSLLNQTLDDYEVLAVNDGSTDGSAALLEEYRQRFPRRLRVLTVENGGQGRARNLALAEARGDFLGFADSDDWADPSLYEKLWRAAAEQNADLAVCDALEEWPEGKQVLLPFSHFERPIKMSTAVWNKLVRRETLGQVRFAEGLWYEDLAYVVQLLLRTDRIVTVPEALYHYRCGHSSTMNNSNAGRNRDLLKVLELLREPMRSAGREEDFASLLINHVLLDGINRLSRMSGTEKDDVIREYRDYVNKDVPDLRACPPFRAETRNRRLVMWLNAHGLHRVSHALLKIKGSTPSFGASASEKP